MSDVTQGNSAEARTETGEIKDQQTTQATQEKESSSTETKTETASTQQTADKKVDDKATSTETKKDDKAPVVPDKYDFKAPEGYTLDSKFVEEATPILKELGLSNDAAQKLVDLQSKHSIETADAALRAYEDTRTAWRGEVIKDPALGDGKEGLKPEVKAQIATAITAVGDVKAQEAFKEAMDLTGVGDNPAFVRAVAAWGKLLSEGTLVRGGNPSPAGQTSPGSGPRSAAAAMYPNLPTSSARS